MSILSTSVAFMRTTRRNVVTQGELLTAIANKTGYSRESIRGTVIGDANGRKLFGQPSFKHEWVVCKPDRELGLKKRFVRRHFQTPNDIESCINYDTPNKNSARVRGLQYITRRKQRVITLAASEGYCVREILKRCPKAEITNVECNPEVLAIWKEKGVPTNNYLGTLTDFIHSEEFASTRYSLLNADLMGYACPTLHSDLEQINALRNVHFVVLTLSGIKHFRNQDGEWKRRVVAKYRSDDPVREWVCDVMNKYTLIDEWFYTRELGARPMRMFVLEVV